MKTRSRSQGKLSARATARREGVHEVGDDDAESLGRGGSHQKGVREEVREEAAFTATLERADNRCIEMHEKRQALDRERMEEERLDRERARDELKEERDAAAELDLTKMKLRVDMVAGCIAKGVGKDGGSSS